VQATRTRRLGPPHEAEVLDHFLCHHGNLSNLGPLHPAHGIEIDTELIGVIQVLRAHGMRVEIDTAQVDHPRQLGGVGDHDLVRSASRGKAQLHGLDPLGPRLRRSFLKEELALGPVHEALESHRPAPNAAQRSLGRNEVILDEIKLRVPGRGKEDLVGIRDDYVPLTDFQDLLFPGHRATISQTGAGIHSVLPGLRFRLEHPVGSSNGADQ
jgi:hypothetical protein